MTQNRKENLKKITKTVSIPCLFELKTGILKCLINIIQETVLSQKSASKGLLRSDLVNSNWTTVRPLSH